MWDGQPAFRYYLAQWNALPRNIYYKGGRLLILSSPLSRPHVINFCCPTCLYSCLWVCVLNSLFLVCMCKNVCFFLPNPCTVKVHDIFMYGGVFLCVHIIIIVHSFEPNFLAWEFLYAHYILSFIHCNQTLLVHHHKLECFLKTNWIVMFKVKVTMKAKNLS